MFSFASRRAAALLATIVALPSLAAAGAVTPTIVYDNTTTPTVGPWAPDGFFPFGYYNDDEPMGEQVTLDGTHRHVTEFHLLVSSSSLVEDLTIHLELRQNDPGPPFPNIVLWDGYMTVDVDGPTTVVFQVPRIEVPDSFAWTASAASDLAGLATYDPPTVGSSPTDPGGDPFFWEYDVVDEQWYILGLLDQPANFGARIIAVPEPASALLLATGGLAAALPRRRSTRLARSRSAALAPGRRTR